MNMKMKAWMNTSLALVLAVGLGACTRGETQEKQSSVDTAPVERRSLVISADASGQIEPLRVVEVKSRVGGEVQQMPVETGQELQQGALIALVDPRDVRNAYSQAEADLALATARVANTSSQRRRADNLAKEGVISAQDREAAQLQETDAKAQLVKARTNLQLAQEKLGDVDIRAPISGMVIEKTVEQGQIIASASGNVSGGTTLIKMADLSTVQARALVDETDIGRVQPGQPAQVTVEAYPGRTFRGTVSKIEPQAVVDQNVTMFPVLVELANPDRLLKPGMNAEVSVSIARREDVVAVPNEAVANPREAATAGAALGLDEQELRDKLASMRPGRGGQSRGTENAGNAGNAGTAGDRAGGGSTGARGGERAAGGSDQSGGSRRSGGGEGGWRSRSGGEAGGTGGGAMGASSGGRSSGDTRPGVVFVKGPNGPEPKFVTLGLSDWDFSEVIRGLEPGTEVYLISVAQLKQQQTQFADRMRQRAGGGMLGGGGTGGTGGGGGQRGGSSGGGGSAGGGGGPRGQ
ncbi:MAG TPA: efflux RND transporter periplasmic adaptor subunit [Thermoanaerobaculia bacterium]|nr:efflux RND transporter periplasmic adaptor subunit [Thermoanaerobaculia bacterium]